MDQMDELVLIKQVINVMNLDTQSSEAIISITKMVFKYDALIIEMNFSKTMDTETYCNNLRTLENYKKNMFKRLTFVSTRTKKISGEYLLPRQYRMNSRKDLDEILSICRLITDNLHKKSVNDLFE